MLPPLLLGIESHHAVFDMCAAPGSKTSQMIEMIAEKEMQEFNELNLFNEVKGFVIANDADSKRAFMLTH